jgi:hypothetical protein
MPQDTIEKSALLTGDNETACFTDPCPAGHGFSLLDKPANRMVA